MTIIPKGCAQAIAKQLREAHPEPARYWVSNDGGQFGFVFESAAEAARRARMEIKDGWPCRINVFAKAEGRA